MNQLLKIRQFSGYGIDNACSIEQIDVRHKSELKWDALDLLGAPIEKANQSRNIMDGIRDSNSHIAGLVAYPRIMFVVTHGLIQ